MKKLTDEQRRCWATDGYLHLEGVLSPGEVQRYGAEVDRVRGLPGYEPSDLPRGHYGWLPHAEDLDPQGFMDRRHLLAYGEAFIELMDRSPVFDLIVDLMGPHILLSMSQAIVRASTDAFPGYTHTDGGEALRAIRVTETSRPLAVKAMYLLTDVRGTDSGNFTVFPGSHLRPFPDTAENWPARAARPCSTTTVSCSCAATTTWKLPTSSTGAHHASGGCLAISVTTSGPGISSMRRRTRRR